MSAPDVPQVWAIRADTSGRRTIIARGHDHDDWRDVAEASPGVASLVDLMVEMLNRAASR